MTTVVDPSLMCAPKQDQRNVGLCTAETLGYLSLRHGPAEFPDFSDFICGQEFLETGDTADVDSMLFVKSVRSPFEVVSAGIGFHTIDMVYDREIFGIGDEGKSDQSVDIDGLKLSISVQIDLRVSNLIDARSEYLSIASLQDAMDADAFAVKASNAAETADFIEVGKRFDRNGSPFFNRDDIHEAGYLSGHDGLMIKDPPHALTSAGPAIMAASSDAYKGRPACRSH